MTALNGGEPAPRNRGAVTAEELVALARGPQSDIRFSDPASAATTLLSELLCRAQLIGSPQVPVVVRFELTADGRRHGFDVKWGPEGGAITGEEPGEPDALVRQDLAELLAMTHGPAASAPATREIHFPEEPGPATHRAGAGWVVRRRAATVAVQALTKASSPTRLDLDELAVRFGTDKWGGHWFTPHYARHFAPYRDRPVTILEIGIGGYDVPTAGGESLRMWKHYFHRGLVCGIDYFDKSALAEPRIRTFQGDQSDPVFLAEVLAEIGRPDIVIDDGSHLSDHVLTSFRELYPRLAPGGLYVIEDIQTSYWSGWNGGRKGLHDPGTTAGFLKSLVDGLHHAEQETPRPAGHLSITDHTVTGLHVYHNVAFIEKGVNREQGAASWIRKDVNPMDATSAAKGQR